MTRPLLFNGIVAGVRVQNLVVTDCNNLCEHMENRSGDSNMMSGVKLCSLLAVLFLLLTTLTMSSDGQGLSLPFHVLAVRADVYILPILPFDYDDLMPCLTREIITAHYEGHHENYRKKMNTLLNEWRESVRLIV